MRDFKVLNVHWLAKLGLARHAPSYVRRAEPCYLFRELPFSSLCGCDYSYERLRARRLSRRVSGSSSHALMSMFAQRKFFVLLKRKQGAIEGKPLLSSLACASNDHEDFSSVDVGSVLPPDTFTLLASIGVS
ncbi:hypothetical protein ACFE04_029017 [Oxalis oulophora]